MPSCGTEAPITAAVTKYRKPSGLGQHEFSFSQSCGLKTQHRTPRTEIEMPGKTCFFLEASGSHKMPHSLVHSPPSPPLYPLHL